MEKITFQKFKNGLSSKFLKFLMISLLLLPIGLYAQYPPGTDVSILDAPFACTGNGYILSATNISTPSVFSSIDPSDPSNATPIFTFDDFVVNAMGFNSNLSLAYGLVLASASGNNATNVFDIILFDQDGNIVNLGKPTQSSGPTIAWSNTLVWNAVGEFDANTNTYYFLDKTAAPTRHNNIIAVDVNTMTYKVTPFTGQTNVANISDFAFSSFDGKLYGISGTNTGLGLVSIDPSSGLVIDITTTVPADVNLATGAGGAWSDALGIIYFYQNASGATTRSFLSYDPSTNTMTNLGESAPFGQFDATACIPPVLTKAVSPTSNVKAGTSLTYTFTITNPATSTVIVDFEDILSNSNGTFDVTSLSPAAPGGSTIAAFTTSTLQITDITVPAKVPGNPTSGILTFSVVVDIASNATSGDYSNSAVLSVGSTEISSIPPGNPNGGPTLVNVIAIINADDDSFVVAPGGTTTSILTNDELAENVPVAGTSANEVTITPSLTNPIGFTIDPTTGNVTVSAGTIEGMYELNYTICENGITPANCDDAIVTIVVDALPIATDDVESFTGVAVTVDVLGNDTTGGDVDPTTVSIVGADPMTGDLVVAGEGTWTVNPTTGAITFAPLSTFTGTPTAITYTVEDAEGNEATATVTLDALPIATNDVETFTGVAVTVDVLANDTTGDDVDPTTVSIVGADATTGDLVVANEGTWSVDPTTGTITFTPEMGYTDQPTPITYTVEDAEGNEATATVTLDALPIATNDVETFTGVAVTVDVLANDTTGDDVDPTTVSIVGADATTGDLVVANEGTWSVDPTTGAITFTPLATFTGTPTPITYTVEDAEGNEATATVTLDVLPIATDDTDVYVLNTAVTVDVLANDTTGDDVDPTTVEIVGANPVTGDLVVANEGTWSVSPTTGAITFTPVTGYIGDPTPITYTVEDAEGNETTAMVTLTFDAVTPIELLSFEVSSTTGTQTAQWTVGSEIDVIDYKITIINQLTGQEVSSYVVEATNAPIYNLETEISAGKYLAILSVNNLDGSLETYATNFIVEGSTVSWSIYPTPADDFINIDIVLNEDSNVQISLTTALGQRLLQENLGLVRSGQYETTLNVEDIASGIYFVQIVVDNKVQGTRKITIK